MKRTLQRLATVSVALIAFGAAPAVVLAAAPSNDTFAGATIVSLGFSEQIDTSEATTDADDTQLNASCGAPATDASVWYALDGTDAGVIVDVSKSDYSAGVLVGVGTQGNLETVACGPGSVAFYAAAGATYYVLAVDDQYDGGVNGGQLSISFNDVPPPPTVDITLNPTGTVNTRTGVATISGTFTCSNGDFIDVWVNAHQAVGRFVIQGSGEAFEFGACDGSAHAWSADVYPYNGKFAGGKTMTVAIGFACGAFDCAEGFAEQAVVLRGVKQ
jgi:hypothetical protein